MRVAAKTPPVATAEPVSAYACRGSATSSAKSPATEMNPATQRSAKSRWRRVASMPYPGYELSAIS
jgi:hypothetical protein